MSKSLTELLQYKHLIDAAAEGKTLQIRAGLSWYDLKLTGTYLNQPPSEYRVKPEPLAIEKHSLLPEPLNCQGGTEMSKILTDLIPYLPLIQAAAEGRTIQYQNYKGEWMDVVPSRVTFSSPVERYRVKPEPLAIDKHICLRGSNSDMMDVYGTFWRVPNVRFYFDPDTNDLTNVEMIK